MFICISLNAICVSVQHNYNYGYIYTISKVNRYPEGALEFIGQEIQKIHGVRKMVSWPKKRFWEYDMDD